jgi:purine-binding chemotaxis protein CheW
MDFLEIRRKARERAAARAAAAGGPAPGPEDAGAGPGATEGPPPPPGVEGTGGDAAASAPPGPPAPVLTPADVLEGDLAASLQGAQTGPFRTWRPGEAPSPPAPLPGVRADPPVYRRGEARRPRPAPAGDPLDEFFHSPDEEGPDVARLGAPEEIAAASRPAAEDIEEYLTFRLAGEKYGISIGAVREVIQAPPITEVPRAPGPVLGVITLRGEVVVVFDPRRRLGLPATPAPEGGRVVVVNGPEGTSGLLVDAVAGVARLPPGALEPCPQGLAGAHADVMSAIGHARDGLFTVLDLAALLRRPAAPGAEGRVHGDGA